VTDEFLPVNNAYELRFTLRALADLSVSSDVGPGDIDEIIRATRYRSLVAKFVELRHRNPNGTEAPMRNVGRPDIHSLHGRDGVRACTWFDAANGVCWFLGCVDQHDYEVFEARAASGDLLPSVTDIEILYVQRNDFDTLVETGVHELVSRALARPGHAARGVVGGFLRLEVGVLAIALDGDQLVDLFIVVRFPLIPPGTSRPAGWPGEALLERLVELATGLSADDLSISRPTEVPHKGSMRAVNPAREMAICAGNLRILRAEGGE
jgi:hypothetical protein